MTNGNYVAVINGVLPGLPTVKITSGSYTGDSTANRAIPHGLGVVPKLVLIMRNTAGAESYVFRIYGDQAKIRDWYVGGTVAAGALDVTAPDATNFYVGNATSYDRSANYTGVAYVWVALA